MYLIFVFQLLLYRISLYPNVLVLASFIDSLLRINTCLFRDPCIWRLLSINTRMSHDHHVGENGFDAERRWLIVHTGEFCHCIHQIK